MQLDVQLAEIRHERLDHGAVMAVPAPERTNKVVDALDVVVGHGVRWDGCLKLDVLWLTHLELMKSEHDG